MKPIRIVVLIALKEEYDAFNEVFPVIKDHSDSLQVRLQHESGSNQIELISVLAEQMGAQSASLSAERAISDFLPNMIVIVGIAGAVLSDVSLCDVVVSNSIADVIHNTKVEDVKGRTKINLSPDFYNVDAELVASFTFLTAHPQFAGPIKQWQAAGSADITVNKLGYVIERDPEVHIALIVSGPVNISANFNALLRQIDRKTGAIETESGGVFARAFRAGIPAVAIRGVSDFADSGKGKLEKESKGQVRRLAMLNATRLLKLQLTNDRFLNVARRHSNLYQLVPPDLETKGSNTGDIVRELEREICARLKELSLEFRSQPDGAYLPIPRARQVELIDELAVQKIPNPEEIIDCLRKHDRIVLRLPRSFPSKSLAWSIAYSLIRQSIDSKIVIPIVIGSDAAVPPKSGFEAISKNIIQTKSCPPDAVRVYVCEEPRYDSRTRLKFLTDEINKTTDKVLVITKADDQLVDVESFVTSIAANEFELAPVSLNETVFFLQKTFDMQPAEAESVAIKLDDTFRKFRLDAHPTYFSGIQEDKLAALITANRRAELIQLAVDALLSLIVAADKSLPNLSRTARERFLKIIVLEKANTKSVITDAILNNTAQDFLKENMFPLSSAEFLGPFFASGLFYRTSAGINFTHPYLESYLLAQALRDSGEHARDYFKPENRNFDHYAYDLYCEMGPDQSVIENVILYSKNALDRANSAYSSQHVFVEHSATLAALSKPFRLGGLSKGLIERAEKLKSDSEGSAVREEKQRLLDAQRYVKRRVTDEEPNRTRPLNPEIKTEFDVLDDLSRAFSLCATTVSAGSESVDGERKGQLSQLCLSVGAKFSDVWTRNRMRINFKELRENILSENNIWQLLSSHGLGEDKFDAIKADLEVFLFGYELNAICEPFSRVLWRLTANAGISVLKPVVEGAQVGDEVERILRASWLIDIDQQAGKAALKAALHAYNGSDLTRIVLANHLLWRVFWYHYKTAGAVHFVNSAKRVLAPLGLAPSNERIEQAKQGAT